MQRILTVWDNDLTDQIEDEVMNFINDHEKFKQIKLLSGLKQRNIEELWESVKESTIIICNIHLFDNIQLETIMNKIVHWIHVDNNSSKIPEVSLKEVIFMSTNSYETAKQFVEITSQFKDFHGENPLHKLLRNCILTFYSNNETYELESSGIGIKYIRID